MAEPTLEKQALKAALALPAPMLRMLAGGGPIERDGRTLDPQFQFIAHQVRGRPSLVSLPLAEARRRAAAGFALGQGDPEPDVLWENVTIPGPDGEIPARVYRPDNQDPHTPLTVWLHQGGGVIGDLETGHVFCTILARGARTAVLSIDYRLAPEHPFPAGLEDALAAFRWARVHAGRFGAPPHRAGVGGDSMGGHLSAVICQELRRTGEPQPELQLLCYPSVDRGSQTQSMTDFADSFPLSRELLDWFAAQYAGGRDLSKEVRVSPIDEPDLAGLAPAIVTTAGFDPLCDQGEAYAHRLVETGVPALYRCYDALPHGFLSFTGLVRAADVAAREIAGLVLQGYQGLLPRRER